MKRAFNMKKNLNIKWKELSTWKKSFIIFKRLLLKQIKTTFLEGESPTLRLEAEKFV